MYESRQPKIPARPAQALAALAADKSWEVREAVAHNPNLEEKILEELAGHWSWMVREAVAKNPSTPAETLKKTGRGSRIRACRRRPGVERAKSEQVKHYNSNYAPRRRLLTAISCC